MKRKTKELLDQLQVISTGHHAIDLLELQDEMRKMHVSTYTILQYIAALEKAQLQASRAEMPDSYIMMVAAKAMLSSERFTWENEYWEDLEKFSKLWTKWCKLYKKVDTKKTIQIQTGGKEAEQFGGAALCGAVGRKEPRDGRPTLATMEDLEDCFDSMAGAAVNTMPPSSSLLPPTLTETPALRKRWKL